MDGLSFIILILIVAFIFNQIYFIFLRYEDSVTSMGNRAIGISKAVAQAIDVEKYEKIVISKEKDDYFYAMQKYFKNVQETEGVKYVYVERQLPFPKGKIEYIFDSEKDSLGELDDDSDTKSFYTPSSSSSKIQVYDKWGTLVSGFTPILDKNGYILGLVGVDYEVNSKQAFILTNDQHELFYITSMSIFVFLFLLVGYLKSRKKERELVEFYKIVVKALIISLSKKSSYTSRHSENVANYARLLATKFGFNTKTLEIIYLAGLLHDIGKIGVSEQIIDKPSKLTDEEFEEIKKHPIYSREMIDEALHKNSSVFRIEEFKVIIDIASYHHERWDGKGYPYGLKGEGIPLTARIISITDAFDAMTTDRPYRKAISAEKAMEEIKRNSGTQFDPTVVVRFSECCTEFTEPCCQRKYAYKVKHNTP